MEHHKELLNLILERRSCRHFLPQPPDRPTLAAIVEAGRYAPSSMNRQACRFFVLTDTALIQSISRMVSARLEQFAGRDCTYGAPVLVLVANRRDNNCALQDAACAMENMMLAAFSLGVGSCWINQLYRTREDREVQEKLAEIGVTPEEMPVAALALGWPAVDFPGPREKTGNLVSWVR